MPKSVKKTAVPLGGLFVSAKQSSLFEQEPTGICAAESDAFLKRRGDSISPFWSHSGAFEV